MTEAQLNILLRYIDQAIDAKLEAREEGSDGYYGNSNSEARIRREIEQELRDAVRVLDVPNRDS